MDSQGRKVIVCDNGTGVRKDTIKTGPNANITFVCFSSLNADMPVVTSLLTFSHQWSEDLLLEPLIKSGI